MDNCYNTQCPRRENCTLWHKALAAIEEGLLCLGFTNPRLIEEAGGYERCPRYYEYKLRRYARGLVWRYREMSVAQLEALHAALERRFGRSNIVRMRCGYEAIGPEEQAVIAGIFSQVAPGHEPQYKGFEEHYIKPRRVEGKAVHRLMK